jgi:hypothetical protein
MTDFIASLGAAGRCLCADLTIPGGEPREQYAALCSPGDGRVIDVTKHLGLHRAKSALFAGDAAVVSTSMTIMANHEISIVDGQSGERRARFRVDLDDAGVLAAIDADAATGFFQSISGKATIRSLEKGQPLVGTTKVTGAAHSAFVTRCQGHFVTCTTEMSRKQIAVIDSSGRTQSTYKLPRELAHISGAAEAPLFACGMIGGGIQVMELGVKSVRKLTPHANAKRDDWARVALDPSGRFLLSWLEPGGEVRLTDLDTGESFVRLELPMLVSSDEIRIFEEQLPNQIGVASSRPPPPWVSDLCLHDGELLTLTGGVLTRRGDPLAPATAPVVPAAPTRDASAEPSDELVESHRSPALVLTPGAKGQGAGGRSHVGGAPDLLPDFAWPEHEGRPMMFFAQIDLAECHAQESGLRVPSQGQLAFFVATDEYGWPEITEHDPGAACVLVVPPNVETLSCHPPSSLSDEQRLERCIVDPQSGGLSLPREGSAAVTSWQLPDPAFAGYRARAEALEPDEADAWPMPVQLMGYPQFVQSDDMEWQVEAISRGESPWKPGAQGSAAEAAKWLLLLQLPSVEPAGLDWGEMSALYFWIHRDALDAGDFSRVYVTMQ